MRLFIALQFDPQSLEAVAAVQKRMRQTAPEARLTRRENLHLTLAFLGEQPGCALASIKRAMDLTAWEALPLCLDHVGHFQRSGGDTWWLGLKRSEPLLAFQEELAGHLRAAGFVLEERPFKPHLTLARQVSWPKGADEGELLGAPIMAHGEHFALFESLRLSGQLVYRMCYER